MAHFDLPLEELEAYRPARTEPADFDQFWQGTLAAARQHSLDARFDRVDYGLKSVEVYDLTFSGYGGQRVKGWFLLPVGWNGPLPCVVEFIGYGGGRGFGFEHLLWPSVGYAYLLMDTRGQGSVWRQGDTPDLPDEGASPSVPGFMTQGVLDPATYYYRRVFTDALRALEAARAHPAVDKGRVAVTGASQGGGISLAAGGLDAGISAVLADVPFLCHFRRATALVDTAPYFEITTFCKTHRDKTEQVFRTLSYFDGVNFAPRITASALFSVGLMDNICPPSTVYAAYNHLAGAKQMRVYSYNYHEGGGSYQTLEKIRFLRDLWG